jgi:serine/threonine-protein kinase
VDQRSDLYSLAAVAYYALLGTAPFPGVTPEQVLALQTTNQFPVTDGVREDVPGELWEVLDRALRSEVEARYPSAAEFLQALNGAAGRTPKRQGTHLAWWRPSG